MKYVNYMDQTRKLRRWCLFKYKKKAVEDAAFIDWGEGLEEETIASPLFQYTIPLIEQGQKACDAVVLIKGNLVQNGDKLVPRTAGIYRRCSTGWERDEHWNEHDLALILKYAQEKWTEYEARENVSYYVSKHDPDLSAWDHVDRYTPEIVIES